jgi:hypothetical protein
VGTLIFQFLMKFVLTFFACLAAHAAEPGVRISTVATNGMPKDIVPKGSAWNFGPGSLLTHKGWQYAAYWDDARQVSVARRKLPTGEWSMVSLPGYQRSESGDRGKGGAISRGFGDGHEKVAMGISPDGIIHLSFDHHLSTLRYRTSKLPVANQPESHPWTADLFGPVQDHLGGPRITSVTYPSFHTDGTRFLLYLRLGGGSGSANSHLFTYQNGKWTVNTEKDSKIIDRKWSGGDGTVNAYPFGLSFKDGRTHLTWCWRDTPVPSTCHDLCYAYSDDFGDTWKNNDGKVIGKRGRKFITADSPGVSVWPIPSGKRYVNGGSMIVDSEDRLHVLVRGENGKPAHFQRDPKTAKWRRNATQHLGEFVGSSEGGILAVSGAAIYRFESNGSSNWRSISTAPRALFSDSKAGRDPFRFAHDGWISIIGQQGKKISVVDFPIPISSLGK